MCKQGYQIQGSVNTKCLESSQWSHPKPTCVPSRAIRSDPCEELRCGPKSECMLINGMAKCMCKGGFTGAEGSCTDIDECSGEPRCASGAICRNEPGSFTCDCPSGFEGDPLRDGCSVKVHHECGPNQPCPTGEQCVSDEFVGANVCVCLRGYTRDLTTKLCVDVNECMEVRDKPACGLNAICKNLPGSYECQCPPGYNGNPFSLCEKCTSVECSCQAPNRLVNDSCVLSGCSTNEPCPVNAQCVAVTGGLSYCACPPGFITTPAGECQDLNECESTKSPCGFGAHCNNILGSYECACPPGHEGNAYEGVCAPSQVRCLNDANCSPNEKCVQPGTCICQPPFFTDTEDGNKCKTPKEIEPVLTNPCDPTPCGPNLPICRSLNGYAVCFCDAKTIGRPSSCKPQCVVSSDCSLEKACLERKCRDPCPGTCGQNAQCRVVYHNPICSCPPAYVGDPFIRCTSAQSLPPSIGHEGTQPPSDPCVPSPCGPHSICQIIRDTQTVCSCATGYIGIPPNCKPECVVRSECTLDKSCINERCEDPCPGVCGSNAICRVQWHRPHCICSPGYKGDPYAGCSIIPTTELPSKSCGFPPNIQNGKVELPGCQEPDNPDLDYYPACLGLQVAILPELTEADYSCNRGFLLSGDNYTIICEAGKWTPEPPKCIKAADSSPVSGATTCLPLQTPAHATARCSSPTGEPVSCDVSLESNSTAEFTCNEFYKSPVGNSYLTCRNERWTTGHGFVCTPVCGVGGMVLIPLIKNGIASEKGKWPWHVAMYRSNNGGWDYTCGGTLISEQAVLTAAHCVVVEKTNTLVELSTLRLIFGKYLSPYNEIEAGIQVKEIKQIIISPDYNTNSFSNDIAILIVSTLVRLSATVNPVCFLSSTDTNIDITQVAAEQQGLVKSDILQV